MIHCKCGATFEKRYHFREHKALMNPKFPLTDPSDDHVEVFPSRREGKLLYLPVKAILLAAIIHLSAFLGAGYAHAVGPIDHQLIRHLNTLACERDPHSQACEDTAKVPETYNYVDALADKEESRRFWMLLISIIIAIPLSAMPWLWLYRKQQDVLNKIVLEGRISRLQLPPKCVRLKDNEVRGGKSYG